MSARADWVRYTHQSLAKHKTKVDARTTSTARGRKTTVEQRTTTTGRT
jgi:hypothetical protein